MYTYSQLKMYFLYSIKSILNTQSYKNIYNEDNFGMGYFKIIYIPLK